MSKTKRIIARTPEDLARVLGLSSAHAREWALQHVLLKRLKEIVKKEQFTHAEIARRAGASRSRVTAILNDNLEHVSSDLLVRVLWALGYNVYVSVSKAKAAA